MLNDEDPRTTHMEASEKNYIRMKIIRRFGDTWFILFFWFFAYMVRHAALPKVESNPECFEHLFRFINIFYYSYIGYLCFLALTLLGCVCTSLNTAFRIINTTLGLIFFFGLFLYANYIMYNLPATCKEVTGDARLFAILYILAWYVLLGTRLLMLVMYLIKRMFKGRHHELEGMELFVDVE